MTSRLTLTLLLILSTAASCDQRPTFAEFEARTWQRTCSTDTDCVLVPIPCDRCGGELSISTTERTSYEEYTGKVSCDDYSYEDDCGDRLDMVPSCDSGRCTAVPEEPATPPVDPCESLRERAAALLATPSAACESDDDCRCYPAFIDCGGVRDVASVQAYGEIVQAGRAADCGYANANGETFNCAPWQCTPTCRNQACTRQ